MLDTHARKYVQPMIGYTANVLLKTGLTPNHVTWAAFLIGACSGWLIYFDLPVVAVGLLWLSGLLDAVDGSMARESKASTPWGTLLDVTFDRLVEISVLVGLAVRFPQAQLLLLLLTASIIFSMTVFLTVGALSEQKGMKSFYYQAGLAERTEGFILFTIMILWPQWLLWTTGIFLVVEVFTALQRMMEARRLFRKGDET